MNGRRASARLGQIVVDRLHGVGRHDQERAAKRPERSLQFRLQLVQAIAQRLVAAEVRLIRQLGVEEADRRDDLHEGESDLADGAFELGWTDGSSRGWRHLRIVARRVAQTYGGQP